jgi:hypothetical protein
VSTSPVAAALNSRCSRSDLMCATLALVSGTWALTNNPLVRYDIALKLERKEQPELTLREDILDRRLLVNIGR